MTLQQLLSGPVLKSIEQELIEIIADKSIVIKIEDPKPDIINNLIDLMQDNGVKKAYICDDYEEAILWAYSIKADELVYINNVPPVYIDGKIYDSKKRSIKRKVKRILNEKNGIIVQLDGYHPELSLRNGACPISIINLNHY